MRSLLTLKAKNFLSLRDVSVDLQELSVLVGPNGAGKSNLLKVIQFLGDTARSDLLPAIEAHGGFDRLRFRGDALRKQERVVVELGFTGQMTAHSSHTAPDSYTLKFWERKISDSAITQRSEEFAFKRTAGRGRRITVSGTSVELTTSEKAKSAKAKVDKTFTLGSTSSALSTLPRLGRDNGGDQISQFAQTFMTFRVFEVDVRRAREPSIFEPRESGMLASDASNLAGFLLWLSQFHQDVFEVYLEDLRAIVPSIANLVITNVGGTNEHAIAIKLEEQGLRGLTNLSEASFGTIRAMALLAMLHDPNPPRLTCVEEIDHGLHPHALDRIVERMRDAAQRTQLLVVTHSPALANRLEPKEIVVCERTQDNGASLIPAIDSDTVQQMAKASGLLPGELWFSGALGGGL